MADENDWKSEYNKLERRCADAGNRAGRDLAAFGVGAVLASAGAYGIYRWKKAQGCACQLSAGSGANGNGSSNGNGTANGNGNGHSGGNGSNGSNGTGKATLNLPNLPNQGGMAPGDS